MKKLSALFLFIELLLIGASYAQTPLINSISPTIVCQGSEVTLNLRYDATQVQWKQNGNVVSTTNSFTYVPAVSGSTVAGGNGTGYQTANQFYNAKNICVDAAGNIFVSDFGNNWIVKWSVGATTGTVVAGYGRYNPSNGTTGVGNDANQLNNPAGICVDAAGNLYIADQHNHRVQKWAPGALFGITVAGGNGEGLAANQLSYPNCVSVDAAGNVYVTGERYERVVKWAPGATSGTTVAYLNGLSRIKGLFVDASGYIYVLDTEYQYVKKFTPVSPLIGTEILFGLSGHNYSGLSVDEFGNVYFCVNNQNNIYNEVGKWDAITGQISYIGSVAGSASNKFNNPTSVFVDKIGSIYVCDNLNDRIQKWNQNKTASYSPINSGSLAGLVTNSVGISSQSNVVTVNAKSSSTSNVNICSNELPYVWNGVNRTAAGTYTFITTNSKGCDSTATLVLTVQSTSTTINNLLPSRICLGNTVTLNVRSDATQVKWLLNGNLVSTDNNLALFPEAITSTIVAGGNGPGYNNNQLNYPNHVFVDGSDNVYVSDYANSRVMKWPPGATRGYYAAGDYNYGSLDYQLAGATGVFIDKMGNLYASDRDNDRIMKWAPGATSGRMVAGRGFSGQSQSYLNQPSGVFVDTSGNIYISDFHNHRIQKWAPGASVGTTVAGGNGAGSASNQLDGPNGLFVDLSGNVYVSDVGNNRIMKWLPGATSGTVAAGGNGWGSAANQFKSPSGVSVDNIGNIYVSDEGNSRIQKWAPGSMNGTTVVIQYRPNGIFVDAAGNIFYSDEDEHSVRKFPAAYKTSSYTPTNGGVLTAVVSNGTGCSAKSTSINVNNPTINSISPSIVCLGSAVTINVSNDVQQVKWKINGADVSATTSLISVPTVVGTTVAGSSAGVSGSSPNQLSLPSNVFVDAIGNLYIADQNNHRVQKWAPGATTGITVAGGNGNGSAENQLSYPTNVFVDKYGTVYVCDNDNHRIQRWVIGAAKGITVAGGNGAGSAANQLNAPLSVFVDSIGTIYVSDPNNYRVQKWTSGSTTGTTVAGGNGMGSAPNQIEFPYGIFVDINGSVYISDFTANRIQKWAPGATSGITVAGGNGAGSAANQLDGPLGVFVDAMGNIYVSELNNDRVQKWAPGATTGITIAGGNGNGNAANQLNTPTSIFIDAKGDFYISDGNNHRVQKWSASTLSANFIPTNAGSLTATVTNTNGCDAISIPVTVKKSTSTTNVSICPIDLPYRWNGVNRTAAGTYTYNTTDSKGCDSIATLVLTVNTTSTSTTILSICQNVYGLPYSWNGANITASGTYTYITTNSKGCDSTATLILTINAVSETRKYVAICSHALPYNWNGVNRTAAGTYIYYTTNRLGCDSTVVLFLTVKATSTSTTNVSICSSTLPYNWNGVNRTAAGTYTYITTNRLGCDSTATLVLTVKASSTSITNVSICPSSLPYGWNGINRVSTGTYTYITTNSVGCDSIATLVLTVKATSTSTSNVSICSSDLPYIWNGISRTSSGTYAFNTTNSVGCDSTATLVLTVRATSASTTNVSICSSSLPYSWNGLTFTSFGTQTAYSTNAEGCDNAATLNLISSDPIINSISPSNICLGNGVTLNLSSDAIQVQWKLNGTTVSTNTSLTSVPAADTTIARRGFTVAGGKGAGAAANQLNSPTGVFVDKIGNIYVSDYYNNRIQKWAVGDTIGTTVAGGNGIGRASNQLVYPKGVFVDAIGDIYIPDYWNRVQKWAAGATSGITVAGGNFELCYICASNQLSDPQGVFVDSSGNIYVADADNHRIQKWAPGATFGTTVAGGNGYGSAANQLLYPEEIFVDAFGNLYISDAYNHRIQKWAPGATFGTTVAGGNGYGSASNQLSYPDGVFVDSSGNIYVSDGGNHRIQKWAVGATMGITVAGGNGAGNTINHLNYPNGVFVDASGNIYVSDNGNNRIQKWSAETQTASYIPTSSGGLTAVVTNAAGCSTSSSTLTVSTPVIPTFTAIAAICSVDSLSALPTTSNNNITGSWTPPLNNLETTTYTFTPNLGVCATVASLTIAVNPVPTNIVATGINNGGYISFTAPQGTGITNYQYSLDNGVNWISPSPAVTRSPLVISNGLNNCTTYQVRLRAVTPTCFGPASVQASFTPTNSILPGVNWTSFDQSYLSNNSYSVTYGNGLFVVVGYNNASYSTDGITWTSANTPSSNNSWRSVTYGNGIFVAVSGSGTGNRVMTSPDGVTWTSRTSSANNSWRSITYGNGIFVAVSSSGTDNRVMTSPDGVTWTSRTSAANNNWTSITYGNSLFVAVSFTGTGNRVMTSSDGITWTSRTTQIAKSWRSVTYGNGLFVAISPYDNLTTGNDVMTSTDGITWTHTSSSFDADWHSIAYGNGLFVAIRGTTSGPNDYVTSISSSDGINWTPTYQDFSGYTLCLTYGNGSFVSVGDYNISLISTYQVAANAPSIDSVTKSGSSAVVAFTTSLPTNLESTAVTNFEYSLDNGSTWITPSPTVTTSPLIIENLANGNYQLKIRAVNSIGTSCPSAMSAFTICSNLGAASGTPTVCSNSALTNIIHTTGITGIGIATGLPAGVTASWANDTIKITGTPTDSGTFNYNIPLAGGCGAISATGTITVNALPEISITGNTTICAGAVSTLTVQSNIIAPTQSIPLDEVAGARLAVGLRKLRTVYTGPALRLRRSSDNQEQDFGFAGNDLDVNAISTWLNGASAYCNKLYDQSGNGGDVSQTSVAAQPLLVISGINNNPSLRFTTAQNMFNAVNYPAPFSVIYGSKVIGGTSARVLAAKNNNWLLGYWGGSEDRAYFEGWVKEGMSATVLNKYNIYAATGTGSISTVYKNGTQIASNGNGLTGPNGIQLNGAGYGGSPTETSNCEFTDVIVYGSALSASEIAQLSNNISSYQKYPVRYLWSTGANSASIAVNTLGNYAVTVTDNNGCSASSSATVKRPSSTTNISICSSSTPYVWNGGSYSSSGVYTHSANSTLGCDSIVTLNLTINSCTTTLNITTFLEGFYTGNGTMRANLYDLGISTNDTETDSVDVNLWSVANLSSSTPDFTVRSVLHTNGTLTAVFPGATLNNSYYVALKHRNSVELWSAAPVTIASTTNYDFSNSLNAAFSDGFSEPLKWMNGSKYAMFSGDVNQDGTVDLFDAQITENGASNFLFGYDSSDCNGDGSTDLFDLQLIDNNSTLFLFYARPF